MSAQQLLPIGLAFIMFAVGIGLRLENFKAVATHPKAFFVGLGNQIIILPLIGFALTLFYNGPAEFAFGIMILAACPGGITSNLLSVLANGNAALSVSLTAVTSLASIFTVPAILGVAHFLILGDNAHIEMPVGRTMAGIFLITGLPIVIGMTLNTKAPDFWAKHQPKIRALATLIFATIVAGAFIGNMENITTHFWGVGLFLVLLNILTMALGYSSARLLKSDYADSITISLECGLQNAALAIFIAINVLGNPNLMIPAIIYALVMNITAAGIIWFVRRTVSASVAPLTK